MKVKKSNGQRRGFLITLLFLCGILEEEPNAQRLEVALRAITYGAKAHFHEALSSNMNNHAAFYANHPDLQSLAEQALSLVQEEVQWMQKYGSQQ